MKRLLIAVAAAAAFTTPSQATVLPYPTAVIVLEPAALPRGTRARFDRLIQRLEWDDQLAPVPPQIATAPVVGCARLVPTQREACVRRILSRPGTQPMVTAHVAVILEAAPGGKVRMTCIGPGKAMRYPSAQRGKLIDLGRALSNDRAVNAIPRRDATECLTVAGEERYPPPPRPS